jgi:DNA-binding transcriptional regulator YiaG
MAELQSEMTRTTVRTWENIANYIGRTPRTVQRWERQFGMPVHRTQIRTGRIVFAFAHELELWLRSTPSKRVCVQQLPYLRVPYRHTPSDGFLNSWKDVARFVGISVRTVQRWERYAGLPVHRPARKLRSPIVAIPEEIERWLNSERSTTTSSAEPEIRSPVQNYFT